APLDAVDDVVFRKQEPREIGPILPGYPGDQRNLAVHDFTPGLHYWLANAGNRSKPRRCAPTQARAMTTTRGPRASMSIAGKAHGAVFKPAPQRIRTFSLPVNVSG